MIHRAPELVVVGGGPSGRKFLARAIEHGLTRSFHVRALDEHAEGRFSGALAGVQSERETVLGLDPIRRVLKTASGRSVEYDSLVLATGRHAVQDRGARPAGCFDYQVPADLRLIEREAQHRRRGVVVGAGRRGLRAAELLRRLGLETHIVDYAPRLLPAWLDDAGAVVLQSRVARRGVEVHLGLSLREIRSQHGRVSAVRFSDESEIVCDIVVFCSKLRARDELGRTSGLKLGAREGIAIDARCRSNQPDVFAVGSVASFNGHCLNWPAAEAMTAETAAGALAGEPAALLALDSHARFRSLGIDIATFGDVSASASDDSEVSIFDSVANTYGRLAVGQNGTKLLGGILVGNVKPYPHLLDYYLAGWPLPKRSGELARMLSQDVVSARL